MINLFVNEILNDIYNIIVDSIDGASMSLIIEEMEKKDKESDLFRIQLSLYDLQERGAIIKNKRGLYISNLI